MWEIDDGPVVLTTVSIGSCRSFSIRPHTICGPLSRRDLQPHFKKKLFFPSSFHLRDLISMQKARMLNVNTLNAIADKMLTLNSIKILVSDKKKVITLQTVWCFLLDVSKSGHFLSGEGRMSPFERPTDPSTEPETDAVSARPVKATAARHSVSKSNPLLLFLWPPQHVRTGFT